MESACLGRNWALLCSGKGQEQLGLPFLQRRRHISESSQHQVEGGVRVALSCRLPEGGEGARKA